ncbi:MAG: hypothetical protein PVG50_02865 [Thiohalophilus sp.]
MDRDVTIELEQAGRFGRRREVQLLDNRELRIIEKQKRRRKEYSIDLLALDNRHRRKFHIAWPWLVAAVAALALTALTWSLIAGYVQIYTTLYLVLTVLVGGMLTVGALYMFWVSSSRREYFISRHARIPLLELDVGIPSSKEVKKFIDHIEKRIEGLFEHFELSRDQQLSGEMRMLRRLVDKKILTEADYNRAKSKLFERF